MEVPIPLFLAHKLFRFVVIDPYEICTIDPKTQDEAVKFLKQFNPNDVLSSDKDWATGLTGLTRRFDDAVSLLRSLDICHTMVW